MKSSGQRVFFPMIFRTIRKNDFFAFKYLVLPGLYLICLGSSFGQNTRDLVIPGNDCDRIYTAVEQMPEFPGGMPGFLKHIKQNLRFPPAAAMAGIDTAVTIKIKFVIPANGKVKVLEIEDDPGYGFREEAIRLVESMPSWHPGMQDGQAVCVRGTIPLVFYLSKTGRH